MNPFRDIFSRHATLNEEQAENLSRPDTVWYPVTVKPPRNTSIPATLSTTIHGILELQSKWLRLRNVSPTAAYEIRRTTPGNLEFQYALPTKRLERKLRTQLQNEIPEAEFEPGRNGLPITRGDTVGGAILTTGRKDWYPLQTDFDFPPINSLASSLHRHSMQDTRVIVQILFQPVTGHPLRSWWRNRRTYQRIGFLRKRKEKLWGGRPPTPREKNQADAIENKAGSIRFHTSIRLLVIGAGEYTSSRVKELAGGFNIFENPATGQYLDTVTVRKLFRSRIYRFASAVNNRRFGAWHHRFQSSIPELAALVSIPNRNQKNINYSQS